MSLKTWLFGSKSGNYKKGKRIVGDWESDIVEEHEYAKTHYKVQTLAGLKELLNKIEAERGRGSVSVDWWVAGMHIDESATVPLKLLLELNADNKTNL